MPESSGSLIALDSVLARELRQDIREILEAVADLARRLDHNVMAPEHLLVVGAEQGFEEMARNVPSLSSFREALLDSLYDDREMFRYKPGDDEDGLYLKPELVRLLERANEGEDARGLIAEVMESAAPRIREALAYARGTEPDVVPPDTLTLERDMDMTDASLSVSAEELADRAASAAEAAQKAKASAPELPYTVNLNADSADDPTLVGREGLAEQVARILLRFHEPSVLLIAPAGAGKTAFIRGLARAATLGTLPALKSFTFYRLKLLDLVAQSHRGQDPHVIVDHILNELADDDHGVLVIDDLHLLVAKQGYPLMSDLIDTVKMHITRGRVRALLTVDADAYEKSFRSDVFFTSQITAKTLPIIEREQLASITEVYRPRLERHFRLQITDEALTEAVEGSLAEENSEYAPPGSTIRLLDEACAMARQQLSSTVTAEHVRHCVSEDAQSNVLMDRQRLKNLESRLCERVLGQELAAGAVARRVRLAKLHLDRKPERPDGVFLFMGPSGVGKTEMARGLARALYDDESRLVRLDMSEYMEPHSVARIIGAPPGYVGYGEDGALTGPVSKLDHCVVLLDEVEKAHPRVLNLFLQVFDDGRLTDSKGRLVSFSDTVIIMTSNIGRELYAIHDGPSIGFGAGEEKPGEDRPMRDAVQDHLLRVLPSEFVNRIDEIVSFRVLDEADIRRIADRLLELEVERWKGRGKVVVYETGVVDLIATAAYDPRLGARHIERNLERLVISLISDAAVTDGFDDVVRLQLTVKDGVICLDLDGQPFVCLDRDGQASGAPPPDASQSAEG